MQTITINRNFSLLALATTLIVPLLAISSASAQGAGSTGIVSDAAPNMVRSDGAGPYLEAVDCANVGTAGSGFWQLRTVQNSGVCNGEPSYWTPGAADYHRWLTLDFGASTAPGDLDGNGAAQQLEFVPARFIFNDGFTKRASTTPVHIYVLKVLASGATTQDTAWAVEYRNPAQITINADGSRTFSLTGAASIADVYRVIRINGGREQSQYVGTYNLPFSVVAR